MLFQGAHIEIGFFAGLCKAAELDPLHLIVVDLYMLLEIRA